MNLRMFFNEKDIDRDETFTVEYDNTVHIMDYGHVINAIFSAPDAEKKVVTDTLFKLDILNGDVKHYLRFLGAAMIKTHYSHG